MDEKIQSVLNGLIANGARIKVTEDDTYIETKAFLPSDLAKEFRANKDEIINLINNGEIDQKYLATENSVEETDSASKLRKSLDPIDNKQVHHNVEDIETPEQIDSRHKSIKIIAKINNFIGWVCVISIILSPIGLIILIQGHLILAIIEVEHNTRSTNQLIQKLLDKLEKRPEEEKVGEVKE